jgi:hypothetical protein
MTNTTSTGNTHVAPTPDVVRTTIVETLQSVRKGGLVFDLAAKTEELIKAIRETGRGGRLTMTLDIKPMKQGDGNVLMIDDDVKIKAPSLSREATIMFSTRDGLLQRKDPRQREFDGME